MIGSECGIPTSTASAPAAAIARNSSPSTPACPPVTYGTNAFAPASRTAAQPDLERTHLRRPRARHAPCPDPCRRVRTGTRAPRASVRQRAVQQPAEHVRGLERGDDALGPPRARWNPASASSSVALAYVASPASFRYACSGPRPGSRVPPRSSGSRSPGPADPAADRTSAPCSTPGCPERERASSAPRGRLPRPPASIPISCTPGAPTNAVNIPMAFDPPADAREDVRGVAAEAFARTAGAPRRRSRAAGRARASGTGGAPRPTR